MKSKLDYLSEINLLTTLTKSDLAVIDAMARVVSYPTGTIIYGPGDQIEHLYLLKRGRVQLYQLTPDGKQLTLAVLGDGNIFGETDMFATGAGNCYAKAMAPTLICRLNKDEVAQFLAQRPKVALTLIEILSREVRRLQTLTTTLVLEDVRTRLAYLLVKLADEFGQPIADGWTVLDLRLTHQELAHMIGATRESVSIVLGEWVHTQAVKTERGRISLRPAVLKTQLALDIASNA